jgi:hypothetical protein
MDQCRLSNVFLKGQFNILRLYFFKGLNFILAELGGLKGFVTTVYNSHSTEEVEEGIKNCVTLFMDYPLTDFKYGKTFAVSNLFGYIHIQPF